VAARERETPRETESQDALRPARGPARQCGPGHGGQFGPRLREIPLHARQVPEQQLHQQAVAGWGWNLEPTTQWPWLTHIPHKGVGPPSALVGGGSARAARSGAHEEAKAPRRVPVHLAHSPSIAIPAQFAGLLLHPLLVVELHIVAVLAAGAVGLPHRGRVVG